MDLNKFFQSKIFGRVSILLASLIIIFVSFGAGVFVGYGKARFAYDWSDNYDRNFGGPPHGIFGIAPNPALKPGNDFPGAHGTFGTILNIGTSSFALDSKDGVEKTIQLSSSTAIKDRLNSIKQSDLKVGDPVVVIGSPNNQGQINARLIRIMR